MKKTSFLKYFPSFLILTGVALWTNSLFFSPITNQNEAKLPHYWRVNLERSSAILDSVNHSMLINAELVSREYDRPIFDVMNQIAGFQQIAIKDLDKKLEQSDSNLYSIINQFNKSTAKSILHLAETNQLVRKKNAQNILDDNQFYYKNSSDELDYSIAFQKNQLYKRVSTYSKYLYNKVGGGCNMCFERFEPNIDFEKPVGGMKVGMMPSKLAHQLINIAI